MKKIRRLIHAVLIAPVVSLALTPASQAAYEYKYKLAVDHTRVAGLEETPPAGFGFLKSITIDHNQVAGSGVSPPAGFGYLKTITIDSSKVSGTADLTDFPVLVSIQSDAALKTTANGGRVTDAEGDDIVFYAADLTTVLDYEVEQYDGATGTLVAWVRLPVLKFALDTEFYLAYGNGSIGSSLADPAGVWDSNFKGVWHLTEATGATHTDSTANANNGTPVGNPTQPNQVSGKISGALDFNLGEKGTRIDIPADASLDLTLYTNWTLSAWVKPTSYTGTKWPVVYEYGNATSLGLASQETTDGRIEHWRNDSTALWSNDPATLNAWNHIVIVRNGTNTTFYLNGSADGSGPSVTLTGAGLESYIGGDTNNNLGNDDFLGLIDEVRVSCSSNSSAARSAGWITTEYNNQNDPAGFMSIEDTGALIDFPVLVEIQNDATIRTTANGGRVTDADGDDLVFYAADLTTVLDYEVEQYDGAAGTLVAWVRMPALANDVDTVFYLAYGNSGISSPQENVAGVWDADYQGVWHLKESGDGSYDDFQDSTSNANHGRGFEGVASQTPAQTPLGKIGNAQSFDGGDGIVMERDGSAYYGVLGTTSRTVSAWIKTSEAALAQSILSYGDNAGTNGAKWTQSLLPPNSYKLSVAVDNGTQIGNTALNDGAWHYVVATLNADGSPNVNQIIFYVDGENDGTSSSPNQLIETLSGVVLRLGMAVNNSSKWIGTMDEARISNTARSAAWITTEYNNQSKPGVFMTIKDSGPLVDFPVLVTIENDAQLKNTANGGQVTDADGHDIIFAAEADGSGVLDHEVESYDPATGSLLAWVRLPALAVAEDTIFYLHYGNSAVSTTQENADGVWDANFTGVYHLVESGDGTAFEYKDSSGTGNHGRGGNGVTAQVPGLTTSGMIGSAQDFDGADDWIYLGPVLPIPSNVSAATISAWIRHDNLTSAIERYVDLGNDIVIRHDQSLGEFDFLIRDTDLVSQHLRVPVILANDTWYHVVGTWDGKTQRIYLDGRQMDIQAPGGILYLDGNGKLSNATETMDGMIDEARVSDTVRSAGWIETEYNNQRWPNKAQWPAQGFIKVVRSICQAAVEVTCGDTTAGSIETPGAWDAFEVTLGADSWLEVYTTGTTDTYGHLFDSNCNEIAQDDTVDYNFHISQTAAAGTYYVQVRHASEIGTGDYELAVECGDDDHGDNIDDATALDCGSPATGKIDPAGDEDYFKVVFWGTGVLTAFSSGGTDTQGTLLDDGGNFLDADDNSKDGSNFQIVRTVDPGVYYVMVSSTTGGEYSVQVNCEYTPVITATAEYGGTISPAGAVGVVYDTGQTFTITPDAGNTIRDVWVDGTWVGAVTSYEFTNVQQDHRIVAVFNADFENCIDIPDIPLDAWYRSAPANVMFVLDDSGSMDWEFMTIADDGLFDNYYRYVFDDAGDNLYGRVLSDNRRMKWKSQWSGYNKLYYDPAVTYDPWPNHEDTAAETLAPADPDTPRSHPMIAAKTFKLDKTYVQYTNDAVVSAIIVNDQDSQFSKTASNIVVDTSEITLLDTGFEEANWDDGFEDNGTTKWKPDDVQHNDEYGGSFSAMATKKSGGNLTSNDLDAGDLVAGDTMTVEFWFRKIKVANDDEIKLYYFDGSNYDEIARLGNFGANGEWLHYQATITDTQYFHANFRIRINAKPKDKKEGRVWVDDVLVKKKGGTGGWELATGSDQAYDPDAGGEYWWTASNGDYTATWKADIPSDGDYDVYARWPAADNHAESVRYTVHHGEDLNDNTDVFVNQRQDGGRWVKLGTFEFDEEDDAKVVLSHSRAGDFDIACADAIKIVPSGVIASIDIKRSHYYVWSESQSKPYLVVLDPAMDPKMAYYVVNDADGDDDIESGEIAMAASPPADVQSGRDYIAERQNFANWYQFYRRRELTATAAVANTIAGLKGVHVGFYSINGNLVQPVVPIKTDGIDKSKKLLNTLYNLKLRAQGTPLRRGLEEVGKYFANSSKMIGKSPYASIENGGSCQQAFTILMTDGYWNGSSPSAGNADGDDNTAYDGGGHADIYADTLADVAMKYYENDLHTDLDDEVPAHPQDPATHQHMVTYAVSFGRTGSLDPDNYDIGGGTYPDWPDPRYVGEHKIDDLWHAAVNGRGEFLNAASPTELVYSLLAISRSIQSRIASSSSVSVNGDPLYKQLDDNTFMYQATYRTDSWIGDVSAYQIDAASGDVADTPEWTAAALLDTLDWDSGRIIATYDGSQGIPFRYDRNVLSTSQQRALGSDLVADSADEQQAAGILNYVRGDRSSEVLNSGPFRDRPQVLGDIVHSSPVYHGGMLFAGGNDGMLHAFDAVSGVERFAYVPKLVFGNLADLVDPRYSHKYFVDLSPTIQTVTIGGQARSILVGGLGKGGKGYYALDITDPSAVTDENDLAARVLWEYPDPQSDGRGYLAYKNRIADIATGDKIAKLAIPPNVPVEAKVAAIPLADATEKTGVLDLIDVGTTGTFLDGDDLIVYTPAPVKVAEVDGELYDPYMGYSYSRPVIARSNDPAYDWLVIFGNGYNSAKSNAVLYILNLETGALIKRIDTGVGNCNGMSSPIAIDIDANGTADYVYAGDLKGNMWKFDLFDTDVANWEVAYADTGGNPAPLFQAKNYGGHSQPITSKPDVMYHCSQPGYMVLFGTGMYLTEKDLDSSETSSIYGIWDYGDDDDNSEYLGSFERTATPQLYNPHLDGVASRTRVKLLEQTVVPGTWTTADGQSLRVITANTPVWGTVADTDTDQSDPQPDPGSATAGDTVHAGWFFDLPNAGEMAVSDVIIRAGKLLAISFTPNDDACGSGGTSIFHAMDSCTGARPSSSFFVNIDEVVHNGGSGDTTITKISSDWKEPAGVEFSGRLQPPVILRQGNLEYHYLSSSTGEVHKQEAAGTRVGIFYWQQIE